jgi:hypothetical protein
MTAHAILSASASKRWLTCTPSARLEQALPEPKRRSDAFDFSKEGTMAHSLAEAKLRFHYGQISADEYEREYEIIKATPYYNEEFERYVDDYVIYVRSQVGEGDRPLFEQRVDFSDWVPDGFGTADVIILSPGRIRVIDLKFGRGVFVDAKDNSQLRLYALGAYSKFREEFPDIRDVEYTIHQPRIENISSDSTSVNKLLDWANSFVKTKAKRAWAGTGDFIPGDHCQFCRAKPTCRARSDFVNEVAKLEFREPALLSDAELDLVFSRAGQLNAWVNDVERFFTDRAIEDGVLPAGYILGSTKPHRRITDEALARQVLIENGFKEEDICPPTGLKSVAQLEKLAKKGVVSGMLRDLIVQPPGEPKLVKAKESAKEDFK